MSFRGFCWLLLGLTPIYLVLAAVLPPADDELYYWCWTERLQLSYYDHPPMTAYLIRAATAVFGDTLFAIRLPAVVSTLTVLLVIGWLTRPRTLLPLVLFTPLFTFGAVLVTPDTPLLMFWALYLAWLVVAHERIEASRERERPEEDALRSLTLPARQSPGSPLWLWALGGVILGCGILGKYTTGLAVIAGFVSFLIAGSWRKWAPGYVLHLAVAFVVTLPILLHNIRYDFAPLRYQWGHSMSSPQPGLEPFLEFSATQFLIFGAQPFAILVWGLGHWRALLADPRLRVCTCLYALPFLFFLYKATRGPLEANWALACYIGLVPVAGYWYATARHSAFWRGTALAAYIAPALCVVLIATHLLQPLPLLAPAEDRITRQRAKEEVVRQTVEAMRKAGVEGEQVFVPNYQWTAWLRFHRIDARQIDGMTRPSHFTQMPERPAGRARVLVFSDGILPPEYVEGYGQPRFLGLFPLNVRGQQVAVYWLLEYSRSERPRPEEAAAAGTARLDQPTGFRVGNAPSK